MFRCFSKYQYLFFTHSRKPLHTVNTLCHCPDFLLVQAPRLSVCLRPWERLIAPYDSTTIGRPIVGTLMSYGLAHVTTTMVPIQQTPPAMQPALPQQQISTPQTSTSAYSCSACLQSLSIPQEAVQSQRPQQQQPQLATSSTTSSATTTGSATVFRQPPKMTQAEIDAFLSQEAAKRRRDEGATASSTTAQVQQLQPWWRRTLQQLGCACPCLSVTTLPVHSDSAPQPHSRGARITPSKSFAGAPAPAPPVMTLDAPAAPPAPPRGMGKMDFIWPPAVLSRTSVHRSAELHRHVNPTFDDRPNVQVAVVKTDPPSSTRGAQPVTASATWVPLPASDSSPALRGEGMHAGRAFASDAGGRAGPQSGGARSCGYGAGAPVDWPGFDASRRLILTVTTILCILHGMQSLTGNSRIDS